MYSMGLFLGLPQDGTPSMLKQITNNGSMSLAQLESHHPMKDVKILKCITPKFQKKSKNIVKKNTEYLRIFHVLK